MSAVPFIIIHSQNRIKERFISQLINDISGVVENLLKYFHGTIIFTSSVSSFPVWSVIFGLNLNAAQSLSSGKSILTSLPFKAGLPLHYCYKRPDVFK